MSIVSGKTRFITLLTFIFATLLFQRSVAQDNAISEKQKRYITKIKRFDSLGNQYEATAPDSALFYYNAALKVATDNRDSLEMAVELNKIGRLYIYIIKDESKAIKVLNKSIRIAKKIKNDAQLSKSFILLWVIAEHQQLKNKDGLLESALEYAQKSNDWRLIKDAYELQALNYNYKGDDENEEKIVLKILEIAKKNDLDSWFSIGLDYGDLLEKKGRLKEANAHYLQLDATKDQLEKSKGYFVYMNDLARLEIKLKKYKKAEQLITELLSYETSQVKTDTFHLSFIYKNLYDLHIAKNDYKKALETKERIDEINQWLAKKRQSQKSKLEIIELKAQLDLERQQLALVSLKTKQEEQLVILISTFAIVVLLVVFIIVLQRNKNKITHQKTELSNLNATKDKLFAILSHDLRSPVANLENNVMLANWGALNQAEFSESVQELGQEVQQVRAMLENMLYWSISQMKELKANQAPNLILPIIEEQMQLINPSLNAKNIRFVNNVPPDLRMNIDKDHLRIILRNLFQNAVKFSYKNSQITVSYRMDDEEKLLEITDGGVGMNPTALKNLFKFGKPSVGTSQEAGTGVGLPLVEELIKLNKLRISVQSQVGEGTVFSIHF